MWATSEGWPKAGRARWRRRRPRTEPARGRIRLLREPVPEWATRLSEKRLSSILRARSPMMKCGWHGEPCHLNKGDLDANTESGPGWAEPSARYQPSNNLL